MSESELEEEEAAEEMLHLLRGDHSGHSGRSGEAAWGKRRRRAGDREGVDEEEEGEHSHASGSSSGYASATSEDAGESEMGRKQLPALHAGPTFCAEERAAASPWNSRTDLMTAACGLASCRRPGRLRR